MVTPTISTSALTGESGLTSPLPRVECRQPIPSRIRSGRTTAALRNRFNLHSRTATHGGAPGALFYVVILYESLVHVRKAMAAYLQLTWELADDFTPDFCLWRIDIALLPAFADEAERDIAAADVIIMAVDGCRPCPPAFQRWKCGTGHDGGQLPRAVIALVEPSAEPVLPADSWNSVLRSAARQIHPEIFVCDPLSPGENGTTGSISPTASEKSQR